MQNKRHQWPVLAAALVSLLFLYVLSLGPVYSLTQHFFNSLSTPVLMTLGFYCWPLHLVDSSGPEWLQGLTNQYLDLWL